MGSGFRDTGRFSKLPYLGMKLAHWPQFQKMHIYTIFLPKGLEIKLIFTLRAGASEIQADFQNCHIWEWKLNGQLAKVPEDTHSCIHLFLPQGSKLSLLSLYARQQWACTWPLTNLPEVAHILAVCPKGAKLNLFLSNGQRFPRNWPIFNSIFIFGHNTWPLAKVPEVAHILSFYPEGRNWAYFCSRGSSFRDTGPFSKLPYLGMKLNGQSARSCTYTLFLPQGVKIEVIFDARDTVKQIEHFVLP